MESTQYNEGLLVVAKEGNNPWWPGEVVRCSKSKKCVQEIESNVIVYVHFFEIGFKAWINTHSILRVSSRDKMETFLGTKHCSEGDSMKYVNMVPPTMQESYDKAWDKYHKFVRERPIANDIDNYANIRDIDTDISAKETVKDGNSLCEVCVNKGVEFVRGPGNQSILSLSYADRDKLFSKMNIGAGEAVFQCDNQCVWKYHSRCVTSNADLVCGCNKSMWQCSICAESVSVAQLFLCSNYECMRAYHKTCLATHIDLQPDMKQCPLHQCINCRLDDLVCPGDGISTSLTYCVKCKLAFHSHLQCLPSSYVTIADGYIICGRHFLDQDSQQVTNAGFCFTCCSPIIEGQGISCTYCLVTYHQTRPCLPTWIDMVDDKHFICNGCKFPGSRRWQYALLTLPESINEVINVYSWKIVVPVSTSNDCVNITVRDIHTHIESCVPLSRVISINLQSLDHLVSFSVARFQEMQTVIGKLSSLVSQVATTLNLHQYYRRNAFILHFTALFPIIDNVCPSSLLSSETIIDCNGSVSNQSIKCTCTNYCSTTSCSNVASMTECTETNCSLISRCRNRRMQRRLYPRQKLTIGSDNVPRVVLEEAVVKNVLVMELVGEVHKCAYGEHINDAQHRMCLYTLSNDHVLDNSRYCGLSRFIEHNDWPNLSIKSWNVCGTPRMALFSCRRIAANEVLTMDMHTALFHGSSASITCSVSSLVAWTDMGTLVEALHPPVPPMIAALIAPLIAPSIEAPTSEHGHVTTECTVIDLCDDDISDSYGAAAAADYDDGTAMVARRPLCPVCLQELVPDYSTQRAMIHCVNCYTVHHLHCAVDSLTVSRRHCPIEKDPRLMRYVCILCRRMDQ